MTTCQPRDYTQRAKEWGQADDAEGSQTDRLVTGSRYERGEADWCQVACSVKPECCGSRMGGEVLQGDVQCERLR